MYAYHPTAERAFGAVAAKALGKALAGPLAAPWRLRCAAGPRHRRLLRRRHVR